MPPQRKGLQEIKTMAGRTSSPGSSHKAYIRLSVLEMERVRREQEYGTFQRRADAAKSRVDMLAAEIASTMNEIARSSGSDGGTASTTPAPVDPGLFAVKHTYGAAKTTRRTKKGEPA